MSKLRGLLQDFQEKLCGHCKNGEQYGKYNKKYRLQQAFDAITTIVDKEKIHKQLAVDKLLMQVEALEIELKKQSHSAQFKRVEMQLKYIEELERERDYFKKLENQHCKSMSIDLEDRCKLEAENARLKEEFEALEKRHIEHNKKNEVTMKKYISLEEYNNFRFEANAKHDKWHKEEIIKLMAKYRQRLITDFPYKRYYVETVDKVLEGIENELNK